MKKVVKFGGSSLASAEQFKKVGDIIRGTCWCYSALSFLENEILLIRK